MGSGGRTTSDGAEQGAAGFDSAFDVLEHELVVLHRRAAASGRAMARVIHPDLEPSAYGLLVRIDAVPGIRLTDLAAYFGVNKSSVSRQVTTLEELGLVHRVEDPNDGRAQGLDLTADGHERLDAARAARRERMKALLHTWPDRDVDRLGRLLHEFNALFDQPQG